MFDIGCQSDIIVVTIIFFLYKIGESMLDATTRPYILKAVCHENFPNDTTFCNQINKHPTVESDIQRQSASYLIYYRILINVPSFILGLFCGAYSDMYGRKVPMMLPSLGSVFGVLFYMASMAFETYTLPLILSGAVVQGFFGKGTVITMAVNSYISDVTESEKRLKNLGTLLAMNFMGLFVGSLLSGILQDVANLLTTYTAVLILHSGTIVMTVLIKETIEYFPGSDEGKSKFSAIFNPTNIKEAVMVLVKNRSNNLRRVLLILFLLTWLNQTCKVGQRDVTVLFVTRSPLSWPKSWYAYLLSVDSAVMGLCLLFLLPVLSETLKLSDATLLIIGIICKMARLISLAFASKTWMVYGSIAIGAFGGLFTSAVRSLVSKAVSDNESGKLFSLLACVETASKLFGVLIFVNLYSATADFFPGFSFIIEAVFFFCAIFLVICVFRELKNVGEIDNLQHLEEYSVIDGNTMKNDSCKKKSTSGD